MKSYKKLPAKWDLLAKCQLRNEKGFVIQIDGKQSAKAEKRRAKHLQTTCCVERRFILFLFLFDFIYAEI